MDDKSVRIAGLTALRRDLKRAEAYDEIDEIGAAFGRASELVRSAAAAAASSTGRRVDEKLAATYKVTRSKTTASLRIGDTKQKFLIGQEWGAYHDRRRKVPTHQSRSWMTRTSMRGWNQFPEVVRGGRFVYPAAAEKSGEILELLADAIEHALAPRSDDEGEP